MIEPIGVAQGLPKQRKEQQGPEGRPCYIERLAHTPSHPHPSDDVI